MTTPAEPSSRDEQRLRSWMVVPGHKPRFLEKCAELPLDAAVLDLEDGVPLGSKELARRQVGDILDAGTIPSATYVRINEVGSPWFLDDLAVILRPSLDGICLPKTESVAEVAEVSRRIARWEVEHRHPLGHVRIVAAIESAKGLLRAPDIAMGERVHGLMPGTEDLSLDLGLALHREREARELLYARSAVVVAARSADIAVLDGVFPDYQDVEGLEEDAGQARRLGFDGKTLFHPRQIEETNRIFSPTEAVA